MFHPWQHTVQKIERIQNQDMEQVTIYLFAQIQTVSHSIWIGFAPMVLNASRN